MRLLALILLLALIISNCTSTIAPLSSKSIKSHKQSEFSDQLYPNVQPPSEGTKSHKKSIRSDKVYSNVQPPSEGTTSHKKSIRSDKAYPSGKPTPKGIKSHKKSGLSGKVYYNGRPMPNITIEIMRGNCFRPSIKTLKSDAKGFYRVDYLSTDRPIYIGINGFSHFANISDYLATCDDAGFILKKGEESIYNINLKKK